ncbi:MAG: uracil phosphoribosyltransferase [Chitinophagales bacterium]|jgi:uracil phosphoribosyltransferase
MVTNLSLQPSIVNRFLAELRDVDIQQDRMRFRLNVERIGMIMAHEISKSLDFDPLEIETQLGVATMMIPSQQVVLATILRAGLPFHQGMLQVFDSAESAFIAAYRREHPDGSMEIQLDYVSSTDLEDKVLIICDPMLATGSSINVAIQHLVRFGKPEAIHVAAVIASAQGVEAVQAANPLVHIWVGAIDDELTAKSYIVPGLGDAGDLAFGEKR